MYKTFWLLFQQIKDTKIIPNIPHTSLFTEFSLVFMQIKKKDSIDLFIKIDNVILCNPIFKIRR